MKAGHRGMILLLGLAFLAGCAAAPQPSWPQQPPSSVSMNEEAESLPPWLLDPGPDGAAACAPLGAGPDALRVATAKAKAELVRQRRAEVASTMAMTSGASRNGERAVGRSEWTERVELSSAGVVEGVEVLQVEEIAWQGRRQLCVRIGPGGIREKEVAHENE